MKNFRNIMKKTVKPQIDGVHQRGRAHIVSLLSVSNWLEFNLTVLIQCQPSKGCDASRIGLFSCLRPDRLFKRHRHSVRDKFQLIIHSELDIRRVVVCFEHCRCHADVTAEETIRVHN